MGSRRKFWLGAARLALRALVMAPAMLMCPCVLAASPATANLSGTWVANPPLDWVDPSKDDIPLTPEYAAILKHWRDAADSGHPLADSVARCEAFGMPRVMSFGVMEILQTPHRVTVITEILHEVRRIYTDGRQMPSDLDPSYDGYSTGHWERGTLVVKTQGLKANNNDQYGIPHSEQLQVIEHLSLRGTDQLLDRVTLLDPKAYTRPWTVDRTYHRAPKGWEIEEYICNTNGAAVHSEDDKQ